MFKQVIWERQKRSGILSILNKYKHTLEDFVNNLDINRLVISRQINLLSDNIADSKDNLSNPKMDDDLLNRSKEQQQYRNILLSILDFKNGDEKIKEGKKKRN